MMKCPLVLKTETFAFDVQFDLCFFGKYMFLVIGELCCLFPVLTALAQSAKIKNLFVMQNV